MAAEIADVAVCQANFALSSLWFVFHLSSSHHSLMPTRQAPASQPASQEGYSSPPSVDNNHNDPFNNAHAARRYYDNESDNADRRDTYATYASDSSNPALNDQHFYDNNGTYDPYRTSFYLNIVPSHC
jgi:hypothetical protein